MWQGGNKIADGSFYFSVYCDFVDYSCLPSESCQQIARPCQTVTSEEHSINSGKQQMDRAAKEHLKIFNYKVIAIIRYKKYDMSPYFGCVFSWLPKKHFRMPFFAV